MCVNSGYRVFDFSNVNSFLAVFIKRVLQFEQIKIMDFRQYNTILCVGKVMLKFYIMSDF